MTIETDPFGDAALRPRRLLQAPCVPDTSQRCRCCRHRGGRRKSLRPGPARRTLDALLQREMAELDGGELVAIDGLSIGSTHKRLLQIGPSARLRDRPHARRPSQEQAPGRARRLLRARIVLQRRGLQGEGCIYWVTPLSWDFARQPMNAAAPPFVSTGGGAAHGVTLNPNLIL